MNKTKSSSKASDDKKVKDMFQDLNEDEEDCYQI